MESIKKRKNLIEVEKVYENLSFLDKSRKTQNAMVITPTKVHVFERFSYQNATQFVLKVNQLVFVQESLRKNFLKK